MKHRLSSAAGLLVTCGLVLSLSAVVSNRAPEDWPQWRGPNRDGVRRRRGLLKDWPAGGPPLAWKATGRATATRRSATAGGRLYTLGARGGTGVRDRVRRRDRQAGRGRRRHGRGFSNDRGDGPRATPTIEGDRVYAFGASGDLSALDAATRQGLLDASTS